MKISELPPGLKELAEIRAKKSAWNNETTNILDYDIPVLFDWGQTLEGHNFWKNISFGNFAPFYNCKVVNFKLKEK